MTGLYIDWRRRKGTCLWEVSVLLWPQENKVTWFSFCFLSLEGMSLPLWCFGIFLSKFTFLVSVCVSLFCGERVCPKCHSIREIACWATQAHAWQIEEVTEKGAQHGLDDLKILSKLDDTMILWWGGTCACRIGKEACCLWSKGCDIPE